MEFRILGPLELRDGRGVVDVPGARRRALLALLLLNANEVVSSDRLLDELWGDEQPGSGVTALQVSVSKLRKALGPAAGVLETRPPGYVLRLGPDDLDLQRFERLVEAASGAEPEQAARMLREALALWHGPALAEFAYEPFAQAAIGTPGNGSTFRLTLPIRTGHPHPTPDSPRQPREALPTRG